MKLNRVLVPLAFAVSAAFVITGTATAQTGPNPLTTKKDPGAYAYYDTSFATSAASDQYITWGFAATKVTINLITAGQQVTSRIYGNQTALRNTGGGSSVNPRAGITAVDAEALTLPALSTFVYDGDGAPIFYGLRVGYTVGACTVIVSAVRGTR